MYKKTVLENGSRILIEEIPHARSVSLGFFIAVGSRYEADQEAGVSHFIEHMLFKGTQRRPQAKEISEAIEGIGGVFNASTGREMTTYWTKVPQGHLVTALDVLQDMLLYSRFDPQELEKERRVIIEEINMTLDTPDDWVGLLVTELQWPGHPLGREIAGAKETISAMSREGMLDYLQRHYHPQNTVVALAGQIEPEEAMDLLAKTLGDWPARPKQSYLPFQDNQSEPRVRVGHKQTEQAHLALSLEGLPRLHPERYAQRLLNTVLGEGMSSRLFLEVREKRGLAYSVSSYTSQHHDSGALGVYAGVDPAKLEEALRATLGELDRLLDEPVPAEELQKAREYTKGRLLLQMEDSFSVASWLGRQEALDNQILSVEEVLAALDAVSPEDIGSLAQRLIRRQALNLAVVGPFPEEEGERLKSILRS